jgi:hypothetical protein
MKTIQEKNSVHIGSLRQDLGPQQKYKPPVLFRELIITRRELTHQALRKMEDHEIRLEDYRYGFKAIDLSTRVIYESADGKHFVLKDAAGPEFELHPIRHPKVFAFQTEYDDWVASVFN